MQLQRIRGGAVGKIVEAMTGRLRKTIKLRGKTYATGTKVEVIESRGIYTIVMVHGARVPVTLRARDVKTAADVVKYDDAVAAGTKVLAGHMSIRRFLHAMGEDAPDNFTIHVVSVLQDAHRL